MPFGNLIFILFHIIGLLHLSLQKKEPIDDLKKKDTMPIIKINITNILVLFRIGILELIFNIFIIFYLLLSFF